jgi:pyruvate kinase
VRTVAPRLVSGRGIGRVHVVGRVLHITAEADAAAADETRVVVAASGDVPGFVAALSHAAAAVVEEGGLTSTAAIAALSLKKPLIVGAAGARERLREGEWVTVDALRGWVFDGRVRLADESLG